MKAKTKINLLFVLLTCRFGKPPLHKCRTELALVYVGPVQTLISF